LPVQRTPDLPNNMIRNGVANFLQTPSQGGRWQDVFSAIPAGAVTPQFRNFQGSGSDPLTNIESVLEEAVGSDPSLIGTLKAILGAFSTSFGRPVAAITDLIRIPGIDAMQKQFLIDHDGDLKNLDGHLTNAKVAMRNMRDLLNNFHPNTSDINQLMARKRIIGNDLYAQIVDALNNETDHDRQQQLKAQKDQMGAWMGDRDSRIVKDQALVDELQSSLDRISRGAPAQAQLMDDAFFSDDPRNDKLSNGEMLGTTHTRPDALQQVMSLRHFLVDCRIQMNGFIARPQ
jgi:hypothetical protein